MKKIYIFSLLLFLTSSNIFSQNTWQETYGGPGTEYATCIINTFDGGFAVTGYTNSYGYGDFDICLLKLHHDGSLQWVKIFGGEEEDIANCIIQSPDSGYVIVGSTKSYGMGYREDMYIVKLNSHGEFQWSKTIGGTGLDIAYSLKQTTDGGFIVVGYSEISYSPLVYGLMIAKISENGTIEWTKIADNVGLGLLYPSVIQTTDGGFGIASTIHSVIGSYDICFIKTNNTGMLQWSWVIGGANEEEAVSVCQTGDNGFAISGYSNTFGAGYPDLYLVKISNVGTLEWTRTIGGNNDDYGFSVINSMDGSFTIAGECFSYGLGEIDMYIVKLDSRGRLLWNKTIGGSDYDFMRSMVVDSDGGYVAVGRNSLLSPSDMFILKTDSIGNTCANTTTPVPHIDSGGTLLKIPVNIHNITTTVMSSVPNISSWGEISNLCLTGLSPNSGIIPKYFSLHQNYPNPFNPVTKINFDLPKQSNAKIIIYDLLGREVTTLVNEQLKPGSYSVDWDASGYASGVYFYSLITEGFTETKKMVLIK